MPAPKVQRPGRFVGRLKINRNSTESNAFALVRLNCRVTRCVSKPNHPTPQRTRVEAAEDASERADSMSTISGLTSGR